MPPHGHGPHGIPLYVWRRHRVWYVIFFLGLVAVLPMCSMYGALVTTTGAIALLVSGVALGLSRRAIRRRVFAKSHELCLVCGYALTGLPENGRCPECGTPFSKADVLAVWKRWNRE